MSFLKRRWIAFALLAIAVLIISLVALRLSDLFAVPKTVMITVDPVFWRMDRPTREPETSGPAKQTVESNYTNDGISIQVWLQSWHYYENFSLIPIGKNRDAIDFTMNVSITFKQNFSTSIIVKHHPDANAILYLHDWYLVSHQKDHNITIVDMKEDSKETGEAYVKASSSSLQCGISILAYWDFIDEHTQDHQLEATTKVTYFDGSTRKIIMPIILEMPIPR